MKHLRCVVVLIALAACSKEPAEPHSDPSGADTGADPSGADPSGPDTGGPDTGGPDTGGPDTGDPDTGGPDTGGAGLSKSDLPYALLVVETCYDDDPTLCTVWQSRLRLDGIWEGDRCYQTDHYDEWDTICDWDLNTTNGAFSLEYWHEYAPHPNGFALEGQAVGGGCFEGIWYEEWTSESSSSHWPGTWSGCVL